MKDRSVILFLLLGLISSGMYAQNIEWKEIAKLPKAMRGTAVSSNNKIYFMEANHRISGVYEYSLINDTWKKITNMKTQGWNVNLAEINGIIYAIGGDPFRKRIESYDPLINKWNKLTSMPTARQHSNCSVVNDQIYVMGGITSWTDSTDKNEVYNPNTDSWQTVSSLPTPFENPVIASIDKNIYALCGNILWMYDTSSDKWEPRENSPAWISVMFNSAVINNYIIIPGGQNKEGKALSSVFIYSAASDSWDRSTDLPKPIQLGGITTLNGKIYIIGGCDSDFNAYDTVFEGTLLE